MKNTPPSSSVRQRGVIKVYNSVACAQKKFAYGVLSNTAARTFGEKISTSTFNLARLL